ncbi:9839_t:CDS:1, partial [Scutellospora calospora]
MATIECMLYNSFIEYVCAMEATISTFFIKLRSKFPYAEWIYRNLDK